MRILLPAVLAVLAAAGISRAQDAPPAQPDAQPTAAPEAPATPAAPADDQRQSSETPAVVIDGDAADTLLGKTVRSASGEDLGRVVDVVVDRAGMTRAAIVDFGGFLGVGSRQIAVDWRVLHFPKNGSMDTIVTDLTEAQLRGAPAYKRGEPVVVVGRADTAPAPAAPDAPGSPSPAPAAPAPAPATTAPAPEANPPAPKP
ncbi:PRC-barrel domain-containing protein [Inquilinus limosus]|uniref:PRC-barrel domain-containing protein n=1 Tax=Inquilinus limosus TaxID=171674 RepID=UPI0004115D2B|nr:PRC-barrel domain-containing protein [Inquilinus limosus]